MAVTLDQANRWVGALAGDAAEVAQMQGLISSATALVAAHPSDPPVEVVDQAILRVFALMYAHRGVSPDSGRVGRVHILADSGALSLLAPFRSYRIGVPE